MNPNPPPPQVAEALAQGQIIKAIKLLRAHSGMDLRSAKEQVDAWLLAGAARSVTELLDRHASTAAAGAIPATSAPAQTPTEERRLPPAAELALLRGERRKAAKLVFEQYPDMSLREALEMVQRHLRSAPTLGTASTVVAGDRGGAWRWVLLALLLAAAAAWWLAR
ncbi:hypothetical protein [Xanthomonas sacchari]|uniref:Ribosomal protein L7/L12 C-terminal domain-containing protein n=1 Tax=Xanthomonas sacchari TaxID=56458 RepID=A0A2P5Z063_9XANT|nr:hypothetical protein [Xanthomonas sacchari]MDV0440291.1 hypothetical protein [Xanthomonas sacchari]PPU80673.1 hypothetical protein XsacCFBP4641_17585 [Xanthomonas sacchari]